MRYERKYHIERLGHATLEQLILLHPAAFIEAWPSRRINNVYWDTPNWNSARDNASGISARTKVRVRWHGDDVEMLRQPVMEIKSKLNMQGRKKLIPLRDCTWQELPALVQEQLEQELPNQALLPSLVNAYQRAYYVSMDGRFRLTVDHGMAYGSWLPWRFDAPVQDDASLVLELKYEADDDDAADEIARHLPMRVNKHSKYARGVALAYDLSF